MLSRQPVPDRKRRSIPFRWFRDDDITALHGLSHHAATNWHGMIPAWVSPDSAVQVARRHIDVVASKRRENAVECASEVL